MSLKTFHIAFISCAVLLALGMGLWLLFSAGESVWGLASVAGGALLVAYEVRFVKRLKHVRYL